MQDEWKSDLLDLTVGDDGIVGFDLFASQGNEVHLALVILGEAVELTELLAAMFTVVTQHASFFIALQTSTWSFLRRRRRRRRVSLLIL